MKLITQALIAVTLISSSSDAAPFNYTVQELNDGLLQKMPYTWNEESPTPREQLRYLTLSHYDFEGNVQEGELVVHELVVDDLVEIFKALFEEKFPISSMHTVDQFEGSDETSMEANNSSAFYARHVAGTTRWSNHSFGTAVDINPLLNPYSRGECFTPSRGKRYLDRTLDEPGMITPASYIYRLFIEHGWQWGGECFYERDKTVDRHHFQKVIPGLNENTNS